MKLSGPEELVLPSSTARILEHISACCRQTCPTKRIVSKFTWKKTEEASSYPEYKLQQSDSSVLWSSLNFLAPLSQWL